jgi:hypothetical protein
MDWGKKLTIGMLCFMSMIVAFGVLMIRSKDDALVDTDYYEKGIGYNSTYKKKENVAIDKAAPKIELAGDSLILTFSKQAEGTIKFMRVANKNLDRSVSLQTDSLYQAKYPITRKSAGLWRLLVEWRSGDKDYLYEQEVMLT